MLGHLRHGKCWSAAAERLSCCVPQILFQYNARRSPITIEELVAASSAVSVGERFGGQSGGVQQVPQPPAAAGGGVDVAMQ